MTITPLRADDYEKPPISWQTKFGRWGKRFFTTNQFGYNPVVGTSYEDIWSPGGSISFLSAADTMNVVSTDAADKGTPTAGTGFRTIRLEGLDGNYNKITEDITMNGTTPVATTQQFLRVYRAYGLTSGSSGTNVGDINITDDGGSSTQAQIAAGRGQTLMAIYTVREGYYGLITALDFAVGGNDSAEVEIRTRSENGTSRIRYVENLGTGSSISLIFGETGSPILIDPKTDVVVRAKKTGTGGDTTVSAAFIIWEVREEEINL